MKVRLTSLVFVAVALPLACTIWNGVDLPAKIDIDGGNSPPLDRSDGSTPSGDTAAERYKNAVISDKPIAYWRYDTIDASRVVNDLSGHNRNCTASSGVTIEDGPIPGMSAARLHKEDNIDCGSDNAFDLGSLLPFTFEGFVLHDDDAASDDYRFLFDRMGGSSESTRIGYYALLGHNGNGDWGISLEHWRGGSKMTGVVASEPAALAAGKWAHFAFTIANNGAMVAYLNGAKGHEGMTVAGPSPTGVVLRLGTTQNGGCCELNGKLADMAVYDHVLDEAAIKKHYDTAYH